MTRRGGGRGGRGGAEINQDPKRGHTLYTHLAGELSTRRKTRYPLNSIKSPCWSVVFLTGKDASFRRAPWVISRATRQLSAGSRAPLELGAGLSTLADAACGIMRVAPPSENEIESFIAIKIRPLRRRFFSFSPDPGEETFRPPWARSICYHGNGKRGVSVNGRREVSVHGKREVSVPPPLLPRQHPLT